MQIASENNLKNEIKITQICYRYSDVRNFVIYDVCLSQLQRTGSKEFGF